MEWKILPQNSNDLLENLLASRGVKTKKAREGFLNPKLQNFESDFQIPGIEKAKKRVEKAIKEGELIIAYGDYDVDGVCGAAVLYLGLTKAGAKVLPYIPHREKEGYGLSKIGLEFARDNGATVVISVDCGIVSFEEAEYAKEIGLDLIITDHHQPHQDLPKAYCIVHSTKLCGTAVAWSFVKNLLSESETKELLDIVAIATVADMMPLLEVNRALVKKGLEKLNQTERVGLLALFNEARIKRGEITSYHIGHIIAPRLNATGRLEHAIDSLRLLCTRDPKKASLLASKVGEINIRRRQFTEEAVISAKLKVNGEEKKIYVLSDATWAPGIIGLVASRICEDTKRPAIAISVGPEESKGSARSVTGINIVEIIRKCEDILVAVGGHPGAAGFTIKTSHIEVFQERLEKAFEDVVFESSEPTLVIDAQISSKQLNLSLAKKVSELEPFGLGNLKPVFATLNMRLSDVRTVGEGKHLKGNILVDFTAEGRKVPFIAFGMGGMKERLEGAFCDLAYTLEIDRFDGTPKLQFNVKDIRII